ncbi:MAG: DNA alkylation repair protein [Crocinitomicaceae bacterium]|nr:DNA alkylation repair protein [Flavobacteriales bacterium]NQZ35966.1 DNA alkylation repair protein [Crocinitomicaceae bacterium]
MTVRELINYLESRFERIQDRAKAEKMRAYMKDKSPFYGISAPDRITLQREWFELVKKHQPNFWVLIRELWEKDEREYQLVAVDLLKKRPKKDYSIEDWSELEWVLTQKSWWDTVDLIASNSVGTYFLQFPDMRDEIIDSWRKSDDFWLNRTCLIFQLKYKGKADFDLLKSLIAEFEWNQEFFIQKAIGWSLRQHSKFDPQGVKAYLDTSDLKGLALREASRCI